MNFTLKALVATVALVAAGSANADFSAGNSGNGELALYVYDAGTGATFAMDLPAIGADTFTTKSILTSASASWTLSGADWTTFLTNFGTTASSSIKWTIFSADSTGVASSTVPGTNYVGTTFKVGTNIPAAIITSATFKTVSAKDAGFASTISGLNKPVNGVVAADPTLYSATVTYKSQIGETGSIASFPNMTNTTLDQTAEFWSLTNNGTPSSVSKTLLGSFTFDYATGSLAYVAVAVPESDTYAMLLAGLGVMGMVARRRLAA